MTYAIQQPPCVAAPQLLPTLRQQGYAVLSAPTVAAQIGVPLAALNALVPSWNDLPPDQFLKDGGRYRRRRHACFVLHDARVEPVAHRAHWQPLEYNALHGGMERWFAPMEAATVAQVAWAPLLRWVANVCTQLKGVHAWYVEAHQFRIDTTDGIGRPTPEGAHRDGVDLVAVFMVARQAIKGGETRVFDATGPNGQRFTLSEPWSVLLLDDERVVHESTPIQPLSPDGYRDTLVITVRSGGFQGIKPV